MSRIIIGLTGPTGSGKSVAANIAKTMGVQVVDCDVLARRATEKGSSGLDAVINEFGAEILNNDGTLNRKALAKIAFSNELNTERLNQTLLPIICDMVKSEICGARVLLDAPTLFESGIDSICTDTVAVLCDTEIRRKRIISRDNLTLNEADVRLSAGKNDEFYIERASHILYNKGDLADYEKSALKLFKKLYGGI